jgi:hypothetical protein
MITIEDVKDLLGRSEEQTVLSLYLNVDNAARANQADPPAWRIWLKRTLREMSNGTAADNQWQPVQERAATFFEAYSPASKGIAVFFGPSWEQVFPLPVSIENQGSYGSPMIAPLLRVLSEHQPYLIVQVSQEEAHFYINLLNQTAFADNLKIDLEDYDFAEKTLMPATAAVGSDGQGGLTQGSNRESFEAMIDAHRARFYRSIVDQIGKLSRTRNIQRVILGGSEKAAHAVHNLMPDSLRKSVIDIVSLPGHYTPQEISAHVQPQALAYEQAQADKRIDDVIGMARAGGRALLGEEAARYALERQQVETLFLAEQLAGQKLANDMACSALRNNSSVVVMFGTAAEKLEKEGGGMAAQLYYSM